CREDEPPRLDSDDRVDPPPRERLREPFNHLGEQFVIRQARGDVLEHDARLAEVRDIADAGAEPFFECGPGRTGHQAPSRYRRIASTSSRSRGWSSPNSVPSSVEASSRRRRASSSRPSANSSIRPSAEPHTSNGAGASSAGAGHGWGSESSGRKSESTGNSVSRGAASHGSPAPAPSSCPATSSLATPAAPASGSTAQSFPADSGPAVTASATAPAVGSSDGSPATSGKGGAG